MPDPALPLSEAWAGAAPAAQVGCSDLGSCIMLHDSQGHARIILSLVNDDASLIKVRDLND